MVHPSVPDLLTWYVEGRAQHEPAAPKLCNPGPSQGLSVLSLRTKNVNKGTDPIAPQLKDLTLTLTAE